MLHLHHDMRALLFFGALLIYGAVGSPTPDTIGWAEIIILVLLIMAINISCIDTFRLKPDQAVFHWRFTGLLLLCYGLSIPVFNGFMNYSIMTNVLRDIIALLFLCTPLLFLPFLLQNTARQKSLFWGAFGIALFFAVRTLWINYNGVVTEEFKFLYLANSPLLLWSSLLCIIFFFQKLVKIGGGFNIFPVLASVALVFLFTMSITVETQRAFLGACLLTFLIAFIINFVRAPIKLLLLGCAMAIIAVVYNDTFYSLLSVYVDKTSLVGLNRRTEEWQAVWQLITDNPFTLLFGIGWGQGFHSPAVGNIYVTYTHSLLSYMLLKTGLIGLLLLVFYLLSIMRPLLHIFHRKGMLGFAYLWPLLIAVFLYASYKSFDFGLLLTLIILTSQKINHHEKT